MKPLASPVWKYFSKINSDTAQCNKCKKILKCKGSSTSSLSSHLKTHKISITETVSDNNIPSTTLTTVQQKGLSSYIKRESLSELLSKCIAKDELKI
jgi:hypothetical protein